MINWLYDLSTVWLVVVVTAATFVVAAVIYLAVTRLAVGSRAEAFKAVSPGMLPPLGIVFVPRHRLPRRRRLERQRECSAGGEP